MFDDDYQCRKDDRCELDDRHAGPCKRYVQHSDMCGCAACASDYENEMPSPRFDCVEL